MEMLGDDELGLILNRVTDPDARKAASLVCNRWFKVEGLSRSSITVRRLDHLPKLLGRFPNLATFETSNPIRNADLALVAQSCPKLEAIVLHRVDTTFIMEQLGEDWLDALSDGSPTVVAQLQALEQVGDQGLCAVANGCPKLSKIVIHNRKVGMAGIVSLITSAARNLTVLDLKNSASVTDQVLKAVGSSSCSKSLKQLVLEGCRDITDSGVLLLRNMCVLEELNLAECDLVTDVGGVAISAIRTLKKLNLSEAFGMTNQTLVAVAQNCLNLEVLTLNGIMQVTGVGIRAFSGHKCLQSLDLLHCCFRISGADLEQVALGCPSFKSIVMDEWCREDLLKEMQETTVKRFLQFIKW